MTRPKVDPDKRIRTAQACDSCKRRKQKCNGLKPCQTCEKRSLTCTYTSPDEAPEDLPAAKRRLIEASTGDSRPTQPGSDQHISPEQQKATWATSTNCATPVADNPVAVSLKRDSSLKADGLRNGRDENPKLPPSNVEVQVVLKSKASTASQPDEDADVYNFTRMLQDPTGRLLYIGDSATLSFLQLIRMIVDNVAGPSAFTNDPRRHRIVENNICIPSNYRQTHLLPDRETADILVNSYFTNVNGLIEVFYRKSFMTTLDMCYADPLAVDPTWLCLLYLALAIGLIMAAPVPGSRDDVIIQKLRAEPVNRAEVFYMNAKSLGDPVSGGFEDGEFWSVQALALMSVYMLAVSKRNAAYAYHGMAVRSAFALGLHREEMLGFFSSSEQSTRRNTWRTLFVLDRFLAASLGRPTSIRESDCSGTTLSSGERNPFPQAPFPTAANANFTSTNAVGLEAAIRSSHVIGVILESVYSSRKISTKVAQEIAENCKGWAKNLDPSLDRRQASSANPTQGIAILHVNLIYYHSIVLLTRPFFLFLMNKKYMDRSIHGKPTDRRSGKMDKFADACVMASSQSVALVQTALEHQYLPHRNPFVLYFVFASALVVIANEFSALTSNPTATNTISNAVNIMHFFAQHDPQGSRLLFILTSFRDVAVREQATRSQQPGPEQQPPVFHPTQTPVTEPNDPEDPMGILLGTSEKASVTSPTPREALTAIPASNPTKASPNMPPSLLKRTASYQSHGSPGGSMYSLDAFFDLARVTSHHSSGASEHDSLGENAEIDFETLWQWPNSTSTGLTPGIGLGMGMGANGGILGGGEMDGGGMDVQGIAESNAPLFGTTTTTTTPANFTGA